jgi:hypothetical protein
MTPVSPLFGQIPTVAISVNKKQVADNFFFTKYFPCANFFYKILCNV